MPPKKSELPGSPKIQELDEEEADESPLLPMTPESKQLAAVIATAVARLQECLKCGMPKKGHTWCMGKG